MQNSSGITVPLLPSIEPNGNTLSLVRTRAYKLNSNERFMHIITITTPSSQRNVTNSSCTLQIHALSHQHRRVRLYLTAAAAAAVADLVGQFGREAQFVRCALIRADVFVFAFQYGQFGRFRTVRYLCDKCVQKDIMHADV